MAALELVFERLADCADPRVPGKRHRWQRVAIRSPKLIR
jgi:hypothetical protein